MKYISQYIYPLLTPLFFIGTFLLSVKPLRDFDIWFHIKSGELIAHRGIIHYDVFSYNTAGREWFPYEWLFQVLVYWMQQLWGFDSIRFLVAGAVVLQSFLLYILLKKVFAVNKFVSLFSVFFFIVSVFEFFTARPHMLAYSFLLANLLLILLYVVKHKNLLFLTIPITILWSNLHGSIFLDVFFFGAYACVCLFLFFQKKNANFLLKTKILGLYAGITVIATILPPLGFTQYRLLWMFFLDRSFISNYIDEWSPLIDNPFAAIIFSITVVLLLAGFAFWYFKKRETKSFLLIIPLLIFIPLAYSASRNVFLAYIPLTLIMGIILSSFSFLKLKPVLKTAYVAVIIIILGINIYFLMSKLQTIPLYYPGNAVAFLKTHHLNGHMFNEYGYGGYLLYQLYPEYQVFFDGRTDLYLTKEMPDTLKLATAKNQPDSVYKKTLDNLWNKYDISFVMLRTEKHTVIRKIFSVLSEDPQWNLIFWDDYTEIFVRNDGKNTQLINEFGTHAATPYLKNPYVKGKEDEALTEYEKMNQLVPSSHSLNAIGYLLLLKGNYSLAKQYFEAAVKKYPLYESPYMNLAELSVKDGDYYTAIKLYQKAQSVVPDRGLIYIRLGELYMEGYQDKEKALAAWNEGLKQVEDIPTKNQLKNLIQTLQ